MKKLLLGCLALVCWFSVASAQETITWLLLSEWGDVNPVIDAFEAENPDINVELEQFPFNELFSPLTLP